MQPTNTINGVWRQGTEPKVQNLTGTAFMEEAGAHTFRVSGEDETGAALAFTGTVSALFLRADDTYIAIDGTLNNGAAEVTLVSDCYHVPGRFSIAVYISDGTVSTCVYAAVGNVYRTTSGAGLDSGASIPTLAQLQAAYKACVKATGDARAAADNAVIYSAAQTLTTTQQAQARENIGAASEADERGRDGLITYRTAAFNMEEVPGATNSTCIGAESIGEIVRLNGTNNASSSVYIRLTGSGTRTASAATVRGWTGALTIPSGRVCRLTMRLLSGTVDGTVSVSVYKSGTSSTLGNWQRHNGLFDRVWVSDGDPVSIAVLVSQGTTLTSAVYSIIIEDITDGQLGLFVPVDGTTVSIDAAPGVRYECGTVNELAFTPSTSGLCEVVFTTGSNPTDPVLPSTVRMPDWWTGVEANRTYDIMILNGTLAGVMSWAT